MTAQPPVMPSAMTVAELLAGPLYWWYGREVAAVVGPTGWLEGVVTLDRIGGWPRQSRRSPDSATSPSGSKRSRGAARGGH